ncbi:MAG: ATP-binding protein [Deltaproteobacteria bacterium]|nr:ATP-binding protein [Deltaproteobacteria bacterium]
MTPMDEFDLWQRTLANQSDRFDPQREILRQAFLSFREHVAQLVGEIGGLLPELTVHDITHLDALWRIADEIAGPKYPLNPAEAFVLGGAFLLHDAAHVLVAYPGGVAEIKRSIAWSDLIAQRFEGHEPGPGSPEERLALFQVLRHIHAEQAGQLLKMYWKVPGTGEEVYLLDHLQLLEYYGDLIGEVAQSHHWPAHRIVEKMENRYVNAPAFLAPADWVVDAMKVAFLLRTADAAHIDGLRAPWFLFALRRPDGISQSHWKFQAKMGQPVRTDRGELRLSAGSAFTTNDRDAWWLAYEVACIIDRELRGAQVSMLDTGRKPFATVAVEHASSPEAFATNVRAVGWEPVNVAPKIGDVPEIIANLGGARIYGDRPELALRELIQNAADAVRASRALGQIGAKEGEIEIALEPDGDTIWLHVTDTGIGMSRFVLTHVLLDFGNSLWRSESMRTELPGLASGGFKAVGQFGIGFFSVFMLGRKVIVTTRRFTKSSADKNDQWCLEFSDALTGRPALRRPTSTDALLRPGTRVSVAMDHAKLERLLRGYFSSSRSYPKISFKRKYTRRSATSYQKASFKINSSDFKSIVANLCPTLDVTVNVRIGGRNPEKVVSPGDWQRLKPESLLERAIAPGVWPKETMTLIDLQEASGALLGRVTYAGSFHYAIVTYCGMRSGFAPNLAGVLVGENSTDLVRSNSRPIASREAWRNWAEKWIDSSPNSSSANLADLHPLCPERDLAVYQVGSRQLSEVELLAWLRSRGNLTVLIGFPTHAEWDQIGRAVFQDDFELHNEILVLPEAESMLADSLGFPLIDYEKRLEEALRSTWGEFEVYDCDLCVGEAVGVEIVREATCYTRSEDAPDEA